eukprot:891890-Prymnesium_polylepis.1
MSRAAVDCREGNESRARERCGAHRVLRCLGDVATQKQLQHESRGETRWCVCVPRESVELVRGACDE